METKDQEEALLNILDQPEIETHASKLQQAIAAQFPDLPQENAAALLKAILENSPSPEQIERDAKIAKHNEAVQLERDLKQARKQLRRQKQSKRKRRD